MVIRPGTFWDDQVIAKTCANMYDICVFVYTVNYLVLLYHPNHPRLRKKSALKGGPVVSKLPAQCQRAAAHPTGAATARVWQQ